MTCFGFCNVIHVSLCAIYVNRKSAYHTAADDIFIFVVFKMKRKRKQKDLEFYVNRLMFSAKWINQFKMSSATTLLSILKVNLSLQSAFV